MAENQLVTAQAQDLATVTATEIDMQISTAKKYPRDEMKAVEKSKRLATITARIAQECQYFRPVGKKDGIQQFADGASIRLAEIMKGAWGNIRIAKRVIGTRDGMVGVEWGAHDLESNTMDRGEVWRPYFNKDAMIPVITAAAMKFAERDAVFAIVPKSYADEVIRECKAQIVGTEEDRIELMKQLIASFAEMGVDAKTLISAVDHRDYPQGSNDEVVFLIGLHNAIKDGICSVDDVFGKQSTKPAGVSMPVEVKEEPKVAPEPAIPVNGKKHSAVKLAKKEDPSFADILRQTARQAGITDEDKLCKILIEKYEFQTPEEVTPEMMGRVIDYFIGLQG